MTYEVVILDKISCQSFINWTYEDNGVAHGREGLMKLQLSSAMKVANDDDPLIGITSVTIKELEEDNDGDERAECHLSSLINAARELNIPSSLSEENAILKIASILKWRGVSFCILTGNALVNQSASKAGFDVYELKNSENVLS